MEFHCRINCDNAAFEDGPDELARLIQSVADQVAGGGVGDNVRDVNGNTVGSWYVE